MSRIAVVSAHADDETLGCGGTLLKHRAAGDSVHWIIGTAPLPPKFDAPFIEKRKTQIVEVTAAYGMASVQVLDFPAAGLESISFADVIGSVSAAFTNIGPDRVYVVHRGDVHGDHRVMFDAVWAGSKPFNTARPWDIYVYETISSTNMAAPIYSSPFQPTGYSDISRHFSQKVEILSVYDTEMKSGPHPRSVKAVEALARYRGSVIGVSHAEAFMIIRKAW